MRRLFTAAAVVAGLAMVPAAGFTQGMGGMPHHEFGLDLGLGLRSPSGGSTHFVLMTPVDVRMGFVPSSALSWEGRLTLAYDSRGFGSNSAYSLAPDIQALLRLGRGSGNHGLMGPYATAGAGLNFLDAPNGTGGTNSSTVLRINGGIGDRLPYGSGAFRVEGFVAYDFKNTTLGIPATVEVGARVGLSLWH
jgi:hypothetical protein